MTQLTQDINDTYRTQMTHMTLGVNDTHRTHMTLIICWMLMAHMALMKNMAHRTHQYHRRGMTNVTHQIEMTPEYNKMKK